MAAQKTCTKCNKRKFLGDFRPKKRWCWDCIREYGSAWYRANRDKVNERRRANYARNRVKMLAGVRKRLGLKRPYNVDWRWADGGAAWRDR